MRKYDYNHRRLRRALLPAAIGTPCHHCGKTMRQDEQLDLDHTADGQNYRGMAHASCNRSEGARRGNAKRKNSPKSRRWFQ